MKIKITGRIVRAGLFLICIAGLLCTSGAAGAQQANALPAGFQKPFKGHYSSASLTDVTRALTASANINIVFDGEPLLKNADMEFGGTVQQALDSIADTFDYKWTLGKHGVVLMTKRFANLKEHPQFHLLEMRQMVQDMIAALSIVPLDTEPSHTYQAFNDMVNSITPQQMQALRSGQQLHAADLSAQQLDLLAKFRVTEPFAPALLAWQQLYPILQAMPASSLQARKQNVVSGAGENTGYLLMHTAKGRDGRPLITYFDTMIMKDARQETRP